MIVREWRSEFDSSRANEYERLETESLHVWNRQPGFSAVLFSRNGQTGVVTLTFWENQKAIDSLKDSSVYNAYMTKLQDSGILKGTPTVEVFEVRGGYLPNGVNHKLFAKGENQGLMSVPEGLVKAYG